MYTTFVKQNRKARFRLTKALIRHIMNIQQKKTHSERTLPGSSLQDRTPKAYTLYAFNAIIITNANKKIKINFRSCS